MNKLINAFILWPLNIALCIRGSSWSWL